MGELFDKAKTPAKSGSSISFIRLLRGGMDLRALGSVLRDRTPGQSASGSAQNVSLGLMAVDR